MLQIGQREQKTVFPFFMEGLMGLSQRTTANYIKHTHRPSGCADTAEDKICYVLKRRNTRTERRVCFVYYQSLHGLDMRRVDGQRLFIPAFGLVHVAPQLGYLPPHVQHVMGCGEEVGSLLRAG